MLDNNDVLRNLRETASESLFGLDSHKRKTFMNYDWIYGGKQEQEIRATDSKHPIFQVWRLVSLLSFTEAF